MKQTCLPKFTDPDFLENHIESILAFYHPNVRAPDGGFHQCFLDDGSVYDTGMRHLVSSTRFVFNYATAATRSHNAEQLQWAIDGMNFIKTVHKQPAGHYAWIIENDLVTDGRAMAYGHAFVMLAAASLVLAGVSDETRTIEEIWDFMEEYFWDEQACAYADERNETLTVLDPYRGQNANMHTCEALLLAMKATGERRYLERAALLAKRFSVDLASINDGLIWEHYDTNWHCDMQYNIDKPDDLFKPWGFQPGHQVEWSKLLLELNRWQPDSLWTKRAGELFSAAMEKGWDSDFGGLVYGFAPDGEFADSHKYFWVHAEAFAAAWRLYKHTGLQYYLDEYNRLWEYSWRTLVDHKQGAWFRIRNRDGSSFDNLKSPPGKTDYHTMGACWDILANQ